MARGGPKGHLPCYGFLWLELEAGERAGPGPAWQSGERLAVWGRPRGKARLGDWDERTQELQILPGAQIKKEKRNTKVRKIKAIQAGTWEAGRRKKLESGRAGKKGHRKSGEAKDWTHMGKREPGK